MTVLPSGCLLRVRGGAWVISFAFLTLTARVAAATDFYVRVGGSDQADGLTPITALASIRQATLSLRNPGDRVVVGPGVYNEGNIAPRRSGIPGRPISFVADLTGELTGDPAGPVVMMPPPDQTVGFGIVGRQYVVIDGFTIVGAFDAAVQVRPEVGGQNSANITLQNIEARGGTKRGFDIVAAGAVALRGNHMTANGSTGISVEGCLVVSERCTGMLGETVAPQIMGNLVEGNAANGILVAYAADGKIEDNSVSDSGLAGILVLESHDVSVVANEVRNNQDAGIMLGNASAMSGANFTVSGNTVENNGPSGGVSVNAPGGGTVVVEDNTVLGHGGSGVSVQSAQPDMTLRVSNNTIGLNGAHGVFIRGGGRGGVVQNNVIFSNGSTGVTVRSATATLLVNNLVYANGEDGIALGTEDLAVPEPAVVNNTLYGNAGWGVRIGTSLAASPGGRVLDNILAANASGGIAVARSSACGYVTGFNINLDGYDNGTRHNPYDKVADPRFVNPSGPDGILGGSGFADDDFHLAQGQGRLPQSAAVDAGSTSARSLGLTGSTAADGAADAGTVDIGFHYGALATQTIRVSVPYMPLFVRQNGSDADTGLTFDRALATIHAATAHASAGVTIVVGPGRYAEGNIRVQDNSGQVSFRADPSGAATGDAPGAVLIDAGGSDTGFVLVDACFTSLSGFHVTGAVSAGIQVRTGSTAARIHDNIVFSNQRRGIEIQDADSGEIRNNLVYANGTGGIRVANSVNSTVINNTVYANGADGILVGGASDSEASPGAWVLRNVVAKNTTGIKALPNSFDGYVTGYNVSLDGFQGLTPRADSDFVADPMFVNPAGVDGVLGGSGFADDDFTLQQAGGQVSPAVDIELEGALNALADGSTRADGLPDLGALDAGYHYPFLPQGAIAASIGAVVFVRASGSDANSGQSPEAALATIDAALAAVQNDGLVVIGPGHYAPPHAALARSSDGFLVLLGDYSGALTGDDPGRVLVDSASRSGPIIAGPVLIDGLMFSGAYGSGLRILHEAREVTVRHSTICGNQGDGVTTTAAQVTLFNNMLCGNRGAGIKIQLRSVDGVTQLLNNTVAGNTREGIVVREVAGAVRGGGSVVRGAARKVSHALLNNNLVAGNGGVGITAWALRGGRPRSGGNLNTDGYGARTAPGVGDMTLDPRFVGGTPSPETSCTAADALSLEPISPAVDGGVGTAAEMGLAHRSVTLLGEGDRGQVDIGFHYPGGR